MKLWLEEEGKHQSVGLTVCGPTTGMNVISTLTCTRSCAVQVSVCLHMCVRVLSCGYITHREAELGCCLHAASVHHVCLNTSYLSTYRWQLCLMRSLLITVGFRADGSSCICVCACCNACYVVFGHHGGGVYVWTMPSVDEWVPLPGCHSHILTLLMSPVLSFFVIIIMIMPKITHKDL